jgi:cytochrome b subunit of formate dehydrogenase
LESAEPRCGVDESECQRTKRVRGPLGNASLLVIAALSVFGKPGQSTAAPLPGSQLPLSENMCAMCHGDATLWQGEQARFHVPTSAMDGDYHWAKGVVCHDCHGGDPSGRQFANTHRKEDGFRATAAEIRESCARCHREEMIEVSRKSVHAKAGPRNENGEGTALDCQACHGPIQHQLLSHTEPTSPASLSNQRNTCGACHELELQTYNDSVHSPEFVKPGPVPTATCTDCHGVHGIYRKPDTRSTLFAANVASTCGRCHPGIDDRLKASVHALQDSAQPPGDIRADGGVETERSDIRQATCIACHQRHEPLRQDANSPFVGIDTSDRCGNCHAEFSSEHAIRHHAVLTEFGHVAAAECAECHGAHDIVALSNPSSPVSSVNRRQTCQQCHPNAVQNFSDFDPHANYKDATSYPRLHRLHQLIDTFTIAVLLFFMFHAVLWILRSLFHVLKYGGHRHTAADQIAIIRFSPSQLVIRFLVMLSLLGLATTGLLIKYSDSSWAQRTAWYFGGLRVTGSLHRVFGVLLLGASAAYIVWLVRAKKAAGPQGWKAFLFGPDSPVPNGQDLRELAGMFRWFFGLGPKPTFDRWTYWEKFDYWAIVSLVVFIGFSGLVIWLPNLFARILTGAALNEAQMIHHEISIMATSFVLAIRYINTHFRPEKFPMDLTVVTGLVSEEHLERARPRFLDRMRKAGQLEGMRTRFPSRNRLRGIIIAAGVTHVIVLVLLAVIFVASLSK